MFSFRLIISLQKSVIKKVRCRKNCSIDPVKAAALMNQKSRYPTELRASLDLNHMQVFRWFNEQNGKELSPIENPYDTPEHAEKRIAWIYKHYDLLTKFDAPVAFLDEKWFYTTNRCNKLKHLPLQVGEQPGNDKLHQPKILNRISSQGYVYGCRCPSSP